MASRKSAEAKIAFYRAYPDPAGFSPPPVARLQQQEKVPQVVANSSTQIVQGALPQTQDSLLWSVPWAHHVVLMEKAKDSAVRRWYMEQTLANGWSRNIDKPIRISTYELTWALPDGVRFALPAVEAIEAELGGGGAPEQRESRRRKAKKGKA